MLTQDTLWKPKDLFSIRLGSCHLLQSYERLFENEVQNLTVKWQTAKETKYTALTSHW